MRSGILAVAVLTSLVLGVLGPGCETAEPIPALPCDGVCLNEFMAANNSTYPDTDLDYPDWIELYNATDEEVYLGGWTVSDDPGFEEKYSLPEDEEIDGTVYEVGVRIAAGGYLLLLADTDLEDDDPAKLMWHLPFRLDRDGEAIGLYDPDGETADELVFPAQLTDVSMSRDGDGGEAWHYDVEPTAGLANHTFDDDEGEEPADGEPGR